MARLHFREFTADDVADAGRLLAERHALHRLEEPLLAARYEDADVAAAEVEQAWSSGEASGAVAESDAGTVGFLIGAPNVSQTWGPNVWVESACQAVTDPETIRDLYAHAAAGWVSRGRTAHYVVVPAWDGALVDAWFRLGFGKQHVHAIRGVDDQAATSRQPAVTVRSAERRDIAILAELDISLPLHQGRSPVFSSGPVPSVDEARAEWEADFDDPEYATFVAEYHGVVIGSATSCSVEKSGMHRALARPDSAGFLAFAAVQPSYRGIGAGRALGETVVRWAAEAGYRSIVTDWRATNLLSSRTWPRLAFHETWVRLHRVVGY